MNKSSDLLEAELEPDSAASRVGLIASWRILRFVTGDSSMTWGIHSLRQIIIRADMYVRWGIPLVGDTFVRDTGATT